MLKLDLNIITSEERSEYVQAFFKQNPNYKPTQHELDTISNYVLYGKDPYINKKGEYDPELPVEKWSNMPSRKEIEIPTKYSTWKKKPPASLDELVESPSFCETQITSIQHTAPKAVFDREQNKDIPTIEELWEIIDSYTDQLKKEPDLDSSQAYKLRHTIIEMRRQQFLLKDIFKPCYVKSPSANRLIFFSREGDNEIDWCAPDSNYACAPMGFYTPGDARFEDPLSLSQEDDDWGYNLNAKYIINFTNPEHINFLIQSYLEIETFCAQSCVSAQNSILDTFNFYLKNTEMRASHYDIIHLKILQWSNQQIADYVNDKHKVAHTSNYISTIYRKTCANISKTAQRYYDYYYNRLFPEKFKKCTRCGEVKLKNSDEFVRRARATDGFCAVCKKCEKQKK